MLQSKLKDKTLMKKTSLGGDAVRLTFSKAVTICITTATGMILSRFCSLEEYGTYSSMLLVINLFVSIFMLGLPSSINYFLARAEDDDEKKHFLSVYYTASTILSFVIGLLLVLSVPLIEKYFENDTISRFWYFLALYPWATIISSSIENVLVVYQRVNLLVICKFISSAMILLSLIAVQLFGFGFSVYIAVFVAVNCLYALIVYIITHRISKGLRALIDTGTIKKILVFSLPIGLSTVVGTLSIEIDKLLIGYFMDTDQLAIYSNAAKELPLTIVAASITAVLLPRAAVLIKNGRVERAVRLWNISTELSIIIISLFTAGIFTYARDVVTFLYSEKYLPGVTVFRIYTLILPIRCTYFGLILNSMGKTKKILLCSILNLILNAVLNPLFYFLFGMEGPAAATLFSIIVLSPLMLKFTSDVSNVRFSKVFPWKAVGVIFIINAAFSILFYYIKNLLPFQQFIGELAESILLGVIWSAGYFCIMRKRLKRDWKELNSAE